MSRNAAGSDASVTQALSDFDLVIFDCDGVLVDSEMLSCSCLSELLAEHGYEVGLQEIFDRFLGRSFSVVEKQYRLALGRELDPTFIDAFHGILKERFRRDLRPMAGAETLLASLTTKYCVASSSNRDRLTFTLAVTNLAGFFGSRVYSSDEVARAKPAPDLFLHAADRMGAEPRRTLVVEDSVNGIYAGKAAEMTVWGFVGGSHYAGCDGSGILASVGADRIVRSLADLSRAEATSDHGRLR